MTSTPTADRLVAEIREEFPAFRIVEKEQSLLSRAIDVALRAVTLGAQNRFMTEYHTVIGHTLYVPASWARLRDIDRVILLRHERIHLRQRERYGFVLMAFLYLLPFLPLGLAYGRARLEWEAYVETLRATAEHYGVGAVRAAELREHIVKRFIGADYGWMWPFPRTVERWYDQAIAQIEREVASSSVPRLNALTPGAGAARYDSGR
jgi:hypothetical protein